MDKKRQILFNLNNFLLATSSALDCVQKEYYNTSLNHSKIVAYICINLAKKFSLSNEELNDLCSYCLCHNIGLFNNKEKCENYCNLSQTLIKNFPFINTYENILKYQCEYFDGSGVFEKKDNEVHLFSKLISFVDFIDTHFDLSKNDIENRNFINEFVIANRKILFSDEIVDSFLELSSKVNFWLDLQDEYAMLDYIYSSLADFSKVLDLNEVLKISTVFNKIINNDNSLLVICEKLTDYYEFDYKDSQTFLISASLKDIGKFHISKAILNKKSKLDTFEYEIIKSYPYFTKKVLSKVMGFKDIMNLASRIQERLDSSGYPYGLGANELSFKDRLLSVASVYDALLRNKLYRKSYSHDDAIKIMMDLGNVNKLDLSIVKDINTIFR